MKRTIRPIKGLVLTAMFSLTACSSLEKTSVPTDEQSISPHSALERPSFIENENQPAGLTAELVYDLLLASIASQRGEIEVASSALIRAAETSQDPLIISRAVRMGVHSKQYAQAYTLGQQWIELEKDNHLAHIITAIAAVMNEQRDQATNILQALLTNDEAHRTLRLQQIGEAFMQSAEGEDAFGVLKQLANDYPNTVEAWMVVAGMAQKNENLDAMRQALDKVLALEPANQNAAGYQLQALSEDQDAQTAFAQTFIEQNPDAHSFRLQYARTLLRNDREDEALQALLDLLKRDKGNSEAINLAALLYQSNKDYAKAAEYFQLRLASKPDDDRSRVYLANALQKLKRFDEAKAQLDMVKDSQELFSAQRQMALVIEEADGIEKALEYLDTLHAEGQAQEVQLIVDKELMLKRADRVDEALQLINDGLAQYPGDETLLYHRALVTVEQEDLEAHEADMRVLLEQDPDNAHYYNTLGYSLLTLSNRLDEADELISKAHELAPEDPYILDSMGWVKFKQGNLDGALEYLEKAFKLDQDAEIAAHLGEVYWLKGDREKARDYWQQGDKIDNKNKALVETKARFLK